MSFTPVGPPAAGDDAVEPRADLYFTSPPRQEHQDVETSVGHGDQIIIVWSSCDICQVVLTADKVDSRDDDSAVADLSMA